jgi:PAS domain S-box-containing protein
MSHKYFHSVPTVLVADDTPASRQMLVDILVTQGYRVVEAENGREALQKFHEEQSDLIMLDVVMPEMDGITVCANLRALPTGKHVPILMITSMDDRESIEQAFAAGATDYIPKPPHLAVLSRRVKQLVQSKRTADALRQSEHLYKAVIEDQTEMICRFRPDGTLTFVNQAYCRTFGWNRDEIIGQNIATLIPEKNFIRLKKHLTCLTLDQPVDTIEYKIMLPDGTRSWQIWTDRAIFDKQGQLVEFQSVGRDVTGQKLAEEQLRKLSRAVEQSPNSIIITNTAGHIEYVNPKFSEVSGYSAEEIRGKTPRILKSGETPPNAYAELWQTITAGQVWRGEFHNRRKDGSLYWELGSISPIKDKQGHITHFVAVKEDVTHRKSLEETWRRYEFIVNTSKEFMTLVDSEHRYSATNESYCYAQNKKRDDIVGRTAADVWGEEVYLKYIKPKFDECLAGNEVYFEGWLDFPALGRRYVDVTYYPYFNADNVATHAIVVSRDRTERKKAEIQLQRVHAQNEQVLASMSSILVGVNVDDQITHWNKPAEKYFGIPAANALGKPFLECGIHWDWAAVINRIAVCRDEMSPIDLQDVKYTRSDSKDGFLNITVNPIAGEPGQNDGFLLVAEDVTEQKVLQSQLGQAQKLEAIGQLAAGIAHEINTPTQYVGDNARFLQESFEDLAGLLTQYQALRQAADDHNDLAELAAQVRKAEEEADIEYLQEEIPLAIQQSMEGVDRVSKIVRAMKEFSHPGVEEKTALDINHAIESTLTVASNEWKYVAEVVTDFTPDLPLVPCLPGAFNQAILNIIINASHAIAAANNGNGQKGAITITTRREDDCAEIRISDTGTGIPPAAQSKIFDPFFTTKEVGKGTGQGLSITHTVIVEKHGGNITFETAPNQGTTFIIRLPINQTAPIDGVI